MIGTAQVATIAATDDTATETATTPGEFTVTLDAINNTGSAILVNYAVSGAATSGSDYIALTNSVAIPNGFDNAIITITPIDDDIDEGVSEDVEITLVAGLGYSVGLVDNATVLIEDNDTAGILVDGLASNAGPATGTTTEAGGTATFTFTLTSEPLDDVVIPLTSYIPTETSGPASITVPVAQWNTGVDLILSGVDDDIDDGDVVDIIGTGNPSSVGDPIYDALLGSDVAQIEITNQDDDTAGLVIVEVDGSTITNENPAASDHSQTIQVSLATEPLANVTINLVSNDTDQATVNIASRIYTPSNYGDVQTFSVTSVDNAIAEGDIAYTLTFSSVSAVDSNYQNLPDEVVNATDLDDDSASITISNVTVAEDDGTMDFDVVLDTEVAGGFDVNFTVTEDDATGGGIDFTATNGTLSFDGTAGEIETISITIINDDILETSEGLDVALGVPTNSLVSVNGSPAKGTIIDNDSATLTVEDVSAGEGDGTMTFTVTLDNEVQAGTSVSYNFSNGTATGGGVDFVATNGALNFTGTAGETDDITVNIEEDNLAEGSETFLLTLGAATNGVSVSGSPATGTILDNEAVGVNVSPLSINTSEDAGSVTFTVSLDSEPLDDVTIALVSNDTDEGTVPPSVTITPANYTGINVTVTILDDNILDGDDTFSIQTGEVTSSDPIYDALDGSDVADVTIVNADTDTASIAINDVTVDENEGTAELTVTLTGEVSSAFTVAYSTSNGTATSGTDYVASSSVISFTGTSGQSRPISISLLDDAIIEPDELFDVVLGSISNPLVDVTKGTGVITITNDDFCLAGNQAPVINNAEPTSFCDGFSKNLDDYTTSATPAGAELKWSDQNTDLDDENNHLITSVVIVAGTYYGFYYDSVNQCVSPTLGVVITASTTPSSGSPINTSACSIAANGNTIVDLDDQLGGTVDAGSWAFESGPIALNPNVQNVIDFNGVTVGVYEYTYTTTTAVAPCVDQSTTISITVTDCAIPCDAGEDAPILDVDQPTNFCDTIEANLNDYVTNSAPDGSVLIWSTSSDPLQITAHRSPNVSAPGAYYGFFFDDADGTNAVDCASPVLEVTLVLNETPELLDTMGDSICGAGEVTLTAEATVGATINWYASLTGTTIEGTGSSFATNVSETTSFYVEATANGCPTDRVEVIAIVLDEPSAGTPTNTVACNEAGEGDTTILDLDDTLEGEDIGIWSLKSSPGNIVVTINGDGTVDFMGLPLGDYVFTYTTTEAEAPCTNQSVDVTITVIDCFLDTDNDGLPDEEEESLGTNPNDPDTDDDGILDGQEVTDGTDPLDDCDSIGGTALDDSDCDSDGLTTAEENDLGTDPNDADSDDDGLTDGEEVLVTDDPSTDLVPEEASDPLDPCDPYFSDSCSLDPVDLAVSKTVDINRPLLDDSIVFIVTVENLSMDRAIDVRISEVLDTNGFGYVSHTTDNGNYDELSGVWSIDELLGEETATLEIIVNAVALGSFSNTAELISSFPMDTETDNNSASVNIVTSQSDCVSCGSICNLFSPNGDGVNEFLILNCHSDYQNSNIQIFDQYGNSVFEMNNYDSSWDGTGQNGQLPKGTYFYVLDLGDGSKVKKGWIQIVR